MCLFTVSYTQLKGMCVDNFNKNKTNINTKIMKFSLSNKLTRRKPPYHYHEYLLYNRVICLKHVHVRQINILIILIYNNIMPVKYEYLYLGY